MIVMETELTDRRRREAVTLVASPSDLAIAMTTMTSPPRANTKVSTRAASAEPFVCDTGFAL
jgi:hypothetical protein